VALKKSTGLPVLIDGLSRIRATRPQPGLTYKQRKDNVKGAFAIAPRRRAAIAGKSVLLIDDVMTTSATVNQCAKMLLAGGARQVYVLTLAKKVK
jgi:predicted amidophosphoribosyltransferase